MIKEGVVLATSAREHSTASFGRQPLMAGVTCLLGGTFSVLGFCVREVCVRGVSPRSSVGGEGLSSPSMLVLSLQICTSGWGVVRTAGSPRNE